MTNYNAEFLVDEKGNKTKVLLNYQDYIEILNTIEDLQDSKLVNAVKNEPETTLADYKKKRKLV